MGKTIENNELPKGQYQCGQIIDDANGKKMKVISYSHTGDRLVAVSLDGKFTRRTFDLVDRQQERKLQTEQLKPISFSDGVKSISDDDLCASCQNCHYNPGEMSGCSLNWPGLEDGDGYVQKCTSFSANS